MAAAAAAAAAFGAGYAATKGLDALGSATGLWAKGTRGKPIKKTGVYVLHKGEHVVTKKQAAKAKSHTKALLKKAFKEGQKHGTKKGQVRKTARRAYKK